MRKHLSFVKIKNPLCGLRRSAFTNKFQVHAWSSTTALLVNGTHRYKSGVFLGLGFQSNTQLPKTNSDGFSHAPSLSIPFFRTWIGMNEQLGMNGTYSVQIIMTNYPSACWYTGKQLRKLIGSIVLLFIKMYDGNKLISNS